MIVEKRASLREGGLRCWLGFHKPSKVEMHTQMGMGFFGGPVTTFEWTCARCKKRGIT